MFQKRGTIQKKKNKRYSASAKIAESILYGKSALEIKELIQEEITRRLEKPINIGAKRGGLSMGRHIFDD